MAKIIYWNVKNKNAESILSNVSTIFNNDFDVMFLAEITSAGKGLEAALQKTAKQYGKSFFINVQHVGGTTSFGHGESIAILSTVELKSIEVLSASTSSQSRDIVVISFYGDLKIATFHLSSTNTAQKTAERQGVIKLLKGNMFQCAIGDWNTEPEDLKYREVLILPPKLPTTVSGYKLDYAVINPEHCEPLFDHTQVLSFFGGESSDHLPIMVTIKLR